MQPDSSSWRGASPRWWWVGGTLALVLFLVAGGVGGPTAYRWLTAPGVRPGAPGSTVLEGRLSKPAPAAQGYVGSTVCAECHAGISRSYATHPMAQSLYAVLAAPPLENYAEGTTFSPTRRMEYRVEKTDSQVLHHELGLDSAGKVIYDQAVPVEYALGSGRRGRSYAIHQDGYLLQSSISWYAGGRWDLSPGYPREKHQRFERPLVDRCLQCHAGRMSYKEATTSTKAVRYSQPPFAELAIGCERCHGPGEAHVGWRRQKQRTGSDPIVNPARLDPPRREAVCNQCHLQGEQQILRYGRRHGDFRPGEQLGETWTVFVSGTGVAGQEGTIAVSQVEQMYASTCFKKSRGALGCISCHDPHSFPADDQKDRHFQKRCLECHQDRGCSLSEVQRQEAPAAGSCIACHMPPLAARDVPHTTQTDHRILRRSTAPPPEAAAADDGAALNVFDELVCPLSPLEMARAQGLAVAERAENQQHRGYARQAEQLLRPVAAAAPDDLDVLDSLALVCVLQGKREEALEIWKQSLASDPNRPDALYSLAVHYQGTNDFRTSLAYTERLIAVIPWRAEFHGRHSYLLQQLGDTELAIAAALHSLELDPSVPQTYAWLADLYLKQNKIEASQRCRETLLRLGGDRQRISP